MSLRMGVSRAIINPPLTITHAGWGAQTHITADGLESDFWTTVLVLSDEGTTAVIVDMDVCMLTPEQSDDLRTRLARELNLDTSAIRISTTHTHAGPMIWTDYYEDRRHIRLSYVEYLSEQTIGAAVQAKRNMIPVTIGADYGTCTINKNRRQFMADGRVMTGVNQDKETDPTVGVVRFDSTMGETVASIVHYAMHPTILGPTNRLASPEYPGVVKRVVESIVGGTSLFLQGAAGDIGPGMGGFTDRVGVIRQIGTIVGCEAAKVIAATSTFEEEYRLAKVVESGASLVHWEQVRIAPHDRTLRTTTQKIRLHIKQQFSTEEAREIATGLQTRLEQLHKEAGSAEDIQETTYRLKRARMVEERAALFQNRPYMDVEVHYICIGEVALIGMPVEPFSQIGIAIREQSPFRITLFSGYTNGWIGYVPTQEAFDEGGYEVETTPFAKDSAERIVAEVVQFLKQLKAATFFIK